MGILAHYGGIDEVAVFVVPIVGALLLLRWAERRVRRRVDSSQDVSEAPEKVRVSSSGDDEYQS